MSEATPRLDLSTPQAKADAAKALPGLMLASMMGNARATTFASQIIGQSISEALQPSVEAMHRLAAYRVQVASQPNRSER